ncbi:hypothetical protein [Amycolatopsis sp. cmx-4-68]|uniref:hypothetical protein n=1 Tax=Amycolatopsis sp. cmx-4-68 TaxID=2790938 RepID=UPI0039784F94
MTKFWEAMGGKLADRWATMGSPALVYWMGGLAAYAYSTKDVARVGNWIAHQPAVTQMSVVLLTLAVVGTSAIVVNRLVPAALTMIQGPWRGPLTRLSAWSGNRIARRAAAWAAQWQLLAPIVDAGHSTAAQRAEYARLDARLRQLPTSDVGYLPTSVGNALLATSSIVADKYGLDSASTWPRLWLVLPQSTRDDLTAARASLDASVAAIVWSLAFCAFAPLTAWVIPVGVALAAAAMWLWVPSRVKTFTALVESAYDLYRFLLYSQLKLKPPAKAADEPQAGRQLTAYLFRGFSSPGIEFAEEKSQ